MSLCFVMSLIVQTYKVIFDRKKHEMFKRLNQKFDQTLDIREK